MNDLKPLLKQMKDSALQVAALIEMGAPAEVVTEEMTKLRKALVSLEFQYKPSSPD